MSESFFQRVRNRLALEASAIGTLIPLLQPILRQAPVYNNMAQPMVEDAGERLPMAPMNFEDDNWIVHENPFLDNHGRQ